MGKPTGFMEIKREKGKERDPLKRLGDWKEYAAPLSDEALSRQGARCMDCGTPFATWEWILMLLLLDVQSIT